MVRPALTNLAFPDRSMIFIGIPGRVKLPIHALGGALGGAGDGSTLGDITPLGGGTGGTCGYFGSVIDISGVRGDTMVSW